VLTVHREFGFCPIFLALTFGFRPAFGTSSVATLTTVNGDNEKNGRKEGES
jgi:hypothetical protein